MGIMEKAREFQKNIYFCFIGYAKAFHCVDHNKLWKILQEMEISDHLTCLLRNLYVGQEATVRTGHATMNCSKLGKEYVKGVYCYPAYLTYCRIHHEKCWAGWSTSWNQDCWEKYQSPQICRWHHPYGRKQRRTSWWKWKRRVKKLA